MSVIRNIHQRKGDELRQFAERMSSMSIDGVQMQDDVVTEIHLRYRGPTSGEDIFATLENEAYSKGLIVKEALRHRRAIVAWRFLIEGWKGQGECVGGSSAHKCDDDELIRIAIEHVASEVQNRIAGYTHQLPPAVKEHTLGQIEHLDLIEVKVRVQNGFELPVKVEERPYEKKTYTLHELHRITKEDRPEMSKKSGNTEMPF